MLEFLENIPTPILLFRDPSVPSYSNFHGNLLFQELVDLKNDLQEWKKLLPKFFHLKEDRVYLMEETPLHKAFHGESSCIDDLEVKHLNKSIFLEMKGTPIYSNQKKLEYVMVLFRDISSEKNNQRLKDEFVSVLSHELRTPITSIYGSLGLLMKLAKNKLPEQGQKLLEISYRNCKRLSLLLNDVLDIQKIESGEMKFNLKGQTISPIIEESISLWKDSAKKKEITLQHVELSEKLQVHIDRERILQVMGNLISNAIKFSPPQSVVIIKSERIKNSLRVSVSDLGAGISGEFCSQIFKKFSQADSSDTRKPGSVGLGLNISRSIIEHHQGILNFKNHQESSGCTFYFELPKWSPYKKEKEMLPKELSKILICEDNPEVAELLSIALEDEGFEVTVATTATKAKELLEKEEFFAMTTDIRMPDQDGISFVHELRSLEKTRYIPIIVISAIADEARHTIPGNVLGIVEWLNKPVDMDHLIHVLKSYDQHTNIHSSHILHVEQNLDNIQMTSLILKDIAEFSYATSLEKASQKLLEETFDLIIVNFDFPFCSHNDFLNFIHSVSSTSIIAFTEKEVHPEIRTYIRQVLIKSKTSPQELLTLAQEILKENSK